MSKTSRVQIDSHGVEGGAQMVLTTEDGIEHKFDFTMENLIGLALRFPRYVDAHVKSFKKTSDPDVQIESLAMEATGVVANETILGHRILLTVEDDLRYPMTWTLTPELAKTLGGELMRLGQKLAHERKLQTPS